MNELTQEVIELFAEHGDDTTIPYLISTSENHIKELNDSLAQLVSENVHIELIEVNETNIKFNFVKAN